jgi:ABC-type dipeptide/oligopeptide/nickel transport system permease subunit
MSVGEMTNEPTHGTHLVHGSQYHSINNWDEVSFILIMILVVVTAIDMLSKSLRLRIIQGTTSRSVRGA